LIGKKDIEKVLHRFAYPDSDLESTLEGQAIRFAGTQDFIDTVHQVTGRNLDWFFDVYLYNAPLPRLIERLQGAQWILEWEVPEGCSFPMPLEIELGGHVTQHKMEQDRLVLDAEIWSGAVLDPQCWILMENRSALMGNPHGETFD
jgi:aminopeptidase N